MEIKRNFNINKSISILRNPTIWGAISDNKTDLASFSFPDKRSHIHLIGYVANNPIGLFIVHPNLKKEYYCHVQVLPKYRGKYSKEFGLNVIDWIWNNTDIDKIYALISHRYKNVIKFSKDCGFNTLSFQRNKKQDKSLMVINKVT